MLRSRSLAILAALVALVAVACAPPPPPPNGAPPLTVTQIASGLSIPWDVAWLPDKTMLFTQRSDEGRRARAEAAAEDGGYETVVRDIWV